MIWFDSAKNGNYFQSQWRTTSFKWIKYLETLQKPSKLFYHWQHGNSPIILENEARVLNGACGISSKPLNSWIRFSASRSKLFKWEPSESEVSTEILSNHHIWWILTASLSQVLYLYSHVLPSVAPFCKSILVIERLLLSTAISNGDKPSLFELLDNGQA